MDFTKKKKKKKKPFTAEDLDAVPGESKEDGGHEGGNQDDGALDDNFDLEVDFSKTKKKKKKKNIGDLIAEADEKHEDKENGIYFCISLGVCV